MSWVRSEGGGRLPSTPQRAGSLPMGPGQKPPDSGRQQSGQGQWWPSGQWLKRTLARSSSSVTQLCPCLQEDRRRTLTCSRRPRLRTPFYPLPRWPPGWPSGREGPSVFVGLSMSPPSQPWPGSDRRRRGVGGWTLGPINCLDSPQPVCMPPEPTPAWSGPTPCSSGPFTHLDLGQVRCHSPALSRSSQGGSHLSLARCLA